MARKWCHTKAEHDIFRKGKREKKKKKNEVFGALPKLPS